MQTVAMLGDSHIPHRMKDLPDGLARRLEGVDLILHTGDVNLPRVLRSLERFAPVEAVRGNNDFLLPFLPLNKTIRTGGLTLALAHSHGGMAGYLYERLRYFTRGYTYDFHYRRTLASHPGAQVIVFGHTHVPHLSVRGGVLLANPGSLNAGCSCGPGATLGYLRIGNGLVQAEVIGIASGAVVCRADLLY